MAILFHTGVGDVEGWTSALRARLPDDEIRLWPDAGDRSEIEFIVMWDIPLDELATFPNLKAILLSGSGGNHLRPFDKLPDVPIVRLTDQGVARDMAGYALSWIIHLHRNHHIYAANQRTRTWNRVPHHPTREYPVTVLGLGNVGATVAAFAESAGYPVRGWSRSPKTIEGIDTFHGPDGLVAALDGAGCLVNVLPLTNDTRKLIDGDVLNRLRPGAGLVNIGRGGTIDDDALFAALDRGQLTGAVLDVFRGEPLDPESPMWTQPGVIVTPHSSGWAVPESAAGYVADNIARIRRGEDPFPLFDPTRGY